MTEKTLFDLLKTYFYGCAKTATRPVVIAPVGHDDFQTAFGRTMD